MHERVWDLIEQHDVGCWGWAGCTLANGYPVIFDEHGRQHMAYRVVYEQRVGPIADGLSICHRCDVPTCCRPDHLFAGTHADNMRDMASKGRSTIGERHPNAVLTDACVAEIRTLRGYGMTLADLADQFGVARATICDVVYRRRWQHLA